jgi:hypothetical protein
MDELVFVSHLKPGDQDCCIMLVGLIAEQNVTLYLRLHFCQMTQIAERPRRATEHAREGIPTRNGRAGAAWGIKGPVRE